MVEDEECLSEGEDKEEEKESRRREGGRHFGELRTEGGAESCCPLRDLGSR